MTLYLTDNTAPDRNRPRPAKRFRPRGEVLPGRRDHQFRLRRHRSGQGLSRHRRDGGSRFALAAARRSDRPGSRRVRPRSGIHRASSVKTDAGFPAAEDRPRTHHHPASRRIRRRRARHRRRDADRASPAVQPQRHVPGRHPPAPVSACRSSSAKPTARRWSPPPSPAIPNSFSAPIPRRTRVGAKESACGCAGIYSAHAAIELYAEAFDAAGALDKLEAFASFHGADFYGLPRHTDTITLRRESWTAPQQLRMAESSLVPLRGGETIRWRVV